MKAKKILLIFLAVVMALSAVGCNKAEETTENDKSYEIVWYDCSNQSTDHELVYEEVNKYVQPKLDAKIKTISFPGSEYWEKIRLIIASKEKFDMCFTSSKNYDLMAKNNAFMPLEELLDKYGRDVKALLPDYVIEGAKVDGTLYALPAYKDYAQENVFYYRKDLAEKYGFDMDSVKTLEDLEPILDTIKAKEPDVYPMLFLSNFSPFVFLNFETISGGKIGSIDLDGDTTKIVNPYETEKAMDYFKTIHRFYEKGFLRGDIATVTSNDDVSGSEFLSMQQELPYSCYKRDLTSDYPHDVLHLSKPILTTGAIRGSMVAISTTTKNAEKTMQYINLLNTDKYLRNLVSLGIDGKHYISVDEDYYKLPDGVKTKADTGYSTYGYTQGNQYIVKMPEGTPSDMFEKYKEFDNNSFKSPALGFAFDSEPVKMEMSAMSNVYNEFIPALVTGTADPEVVLPQAIAKFKEAGLDALIAEMQKQYDEWRKNK